jgi:hypothetical protein
MIEEQRLECLRLAVYAQEHNPVEAAARYMAFIRSADGISSRTGIQKPSSTGGVTGTVDVQDEK